MQLEKRMMNWLLIIMLATIELFLFPMIFYVLFPKYQNAIGSILGFAGAIIGGSLTLIGVRSTIRHANKKERLSKLPKDIINIWKIRKALTLTEAAVDSQKPDHLSVWAFLRDFYKSNEGWITDMAAEIDAVTYNIINLIFTHIDDFNYESSDEKIEKWYIEFDKLLDDFDQRIHVLESDYNKLTNEFTVRENE